MFSTRNFLHFSCLSLFFLAANLQNNGDAVLAQVAGVPTVESQYHRRLEFDPKENISPDLPAANGNGGDVRNDIDKEDDVTATDANHRGNGNDNGVNNNNNNNDEDDEMDVQIDRPFHLTLNNGGNVEATFFDEHEPIWCRVFFVYNRIVCDEDGASDIDLVIPFEKYFDDAGNRYIHYKDFNGEKQVLMFNEPKGHQAMQQEQNYGSSSIFGFNVPRPQRGVIIMLLLAVSACFVCASLLICYSRKYCSPNYYEFDVDEKPQISYSDNDDERETERSWSYGSDGNLSDGFEYSQGHMEFEEVDLESAGKQPPSSGSEPNTTSVSGRPRITAFV